MGEMAQDHDYDMNESELAQFARQDQERGGKAMPVVNGKLEKFQLSKAKAGYNLKGTWDNDKEWNYIPKAASRPLFEAGAVVQDGVFEQDGNPRFKVVGSPVMAISTEFKGKGNPAVVTVILGAPVDEPEATGGGNPWDDEPALPAAKPQATGYDLKGWADVAGCYAAAFKIVRKTWNEEMGRDPADEAMEQGIGKVYIEARKIGLHAPPAKQETQKAPPPPPEDEPPLSDEEDDDLPF